MSLEGHQRHQLHSQLEQLLWTLLLPFELRSKKFSEGQGIKVEGLWVRQLIIHLQFRKEPETEII